MPATAKLTHHITLRPPLDGDVLVAVALSPSGDAVGLWAAGPDAAALVGRQPALPSQPSFPTVLLDPPVTIRVAVQDPAGRVVQVTTVQDFPFAHPSVGVLPDGDLVLVGGRCAWWRSGVVPNAGVWSSNGDLRATGVVGDGVARIEVTTEGEIWVAYLDEGIYGNFGWGRPGPRPIGARGLLRFSRSFDLLWRYPDDVRHPIDDGPHLNLVDGVLWMTHDSAYPVVRVERGELTVWETPVGSASAVLVDEDGVALVGRSVLVGTLGDRSFLPTSSCELDLLPSWPTGWIARGPTLHVFDPDGGWWTTDLDALRAAADRARVESGADLAGQTRSDPPR